MREFFESYTRLVSSRAGGGVPAMVGSNQRIWSQSSTEICESAPELAAAVPALNDHHG